MNRRVPVLLALVSVCATSPVSAQDTEWNRYTLEGLAGVHVRAEASDVCEDVGVSGATVQGNASAALLEAEVPLLSEQEMLADVALPELRISLECAVGGNGAADVVGYTVGVRVQQAAKMIRDEQVTLAEAVTWYTTGTGVTSRSGAAAAIEEALRAKLEEFAAAYAAANAEEGGSR